MPLTYEPRAAPWEHLLVEKIFQKGGNGVSGIARWLQRHVRATDYTPPGTILRTDFRRSVAELNIDVSPEDFAAVAECCAYDGDHAGEPRSLLSVRHIANRLVDLAAAGSGQASVFGQNESSPLTGTETERATLEARKAAVSEARAFNPDVEEPGRGHPHSPAAPAARSDPNSLLYDNPSGANVRAPPPPQLEAAYVRGEIPESPGAKAIAEYQGRRLERIGSGVVAHVGVPPKLALPVDYAPDAMPALDTVQAVEEAVRAALMARTTSKSQAMRILSGMPVAGGRVKHRDALTKSQFREAMLRLNVNPADPTLVDDLFAKHDADGNGHLDYAEFVEFLMPSDFAPVSPAEYRRAYRGYTHATGDLVDATSSGAGARSGSPSSLPAPESPPPHPLGADNRVLVGAAGTPTPKGRSTRAEAARNAAIAEGWRTGSRVEAARDARMHAMLPADAAKPGKSTAGSGPGGYSSKLYLNKPGGGDHSLTVRRIEAAVLHHLRNANGGDATPKHAENLFRFFDTDDDGTLSSANLRKALLRINVDPTDADFAEFVAKHANGRANGEVDIKTLAHAIVPTTEQMKAARGGVVERWGADGADRWAGYDRHKIAATLENLNEPNLFDRAKAGDAGNVPKVHTVHELEELLREKALTLEKGFRGARTWFKYFDRDGSGGVDKDEFQMAMNQFNIAPTPEVIDEMFLKYDKSGEGELEYMELLAALAPAKGLYHSTADMLESLDVNAPARVSAGDGVKQPARLSLGAPRAHADDQGKQRLSVKQFKRKLTDWMAARGQGLMALRKLFKELDYDNSGYIDREEFAKGIMRMNIHPTKESLAKILDYYDDDGNGTIEFEEFIASVLPDHDYRGYEDGNWQAIAHHDPKPPNIMPTSHMLYGNQLEKLLIDKIIQASDKGGSARKIFRELDWDHSGTVDKDEFRKWIKYLNFFPDEGTFERLWRNYDRDNKGYFEYKDFVNRVAPKHDLNASVF